MTHPRRPCTDPRYRGAVEANRGWFARARVRVGDVVSLRLRR
jgi:uncharacterized membrane protein (UPF0127 family)